MKARWAWLFWSALITLVGVAWLFQKVGVSLSEWIHMQLIGMILAAGIAFVAMVKSYPGKWPAAVVLICAAPMSQMMLSEDVLDAMRFLGAPAVVMVGGTVFTVLAALVVLVAKPSPPPGQRIARAEVVD